eukprot:TRINITY_DN5618_c0_g2_i3.p1 TRINITY_DN5618_c0_g2~~TRINITY_DN5618_c0_g2_i3.p1  ORF type:complete len:558 (+),score=88.72 TRINITY_DN5618_c0_g2_i3:57-1730(+)
MEDDSSQSRTRDSSGRSGEDQKGSGCPNFGRGGGPLLLALFGPFYLLYVALDREAVIEAKRWAAQDWQAVDCKVVATGLAYRGTCWSWDAAPSCSSACQGESGVELWKQVTSIPTPEDKLVTQGRRLRCQHAYLPWLSVSLPGSMPGETACAYQYGIGDFDDIVSGSESDASETIASAGGIGSHTVCLKPHSGSTCAVALLNATRLVETRRRSSSFDFVLVWFLLPMSLISWLCIACLALSCMFNHFQKKPEARSSAFLEGSAAERLHLKDARSRRLELPPGHWTQWNEADVKIAAERLFDYYDEDQSGFLDVDEMVGLFADIGIRDRHLVKRTMSQLDHDDSGVIESSEFQDLCRQIFWNGHQALVMQEFARQQEIMGTQAISATGLAKNRPLLFIEAIVLIVIFCGDLYAHSRYGHQTCDTRFDRYLIGVAILIGFQIAVLALIAWTGRKCKQCGCLPGVMVAQGLMTVLHVFVLIYAAAGTAMEVSSEVCGKELRKWSLLAIMMLWATGLYVLITAIGGFVAAYTSVRRGTSLSTLSLDDDPDSDSSYAESDIE